ncbi:hypothetical protein [Streptomyces sp. BBFR102]
MAADDDLELADLRVVLKTWTYGYERVAAARTAAGETGAAV